MKFLKSLIAVIAIVVTNAAQLKNRNTQVPVAKKDTNAPKEICAAATDEKVCLLKTTDANKEKKGDSCKWENGKCSRKSGLFTEIDVKPNAEEITKRAKICRPENNKPTAGAAVTEAACKILPVCQWRKGTKETKNKDVTKCRVNFEKKLFTETETEQIKMVTPPVMPDLKFCEDKVNNTKIDCGVNAATKGKCEWKKGTTGADKDVEKCRPKA